MMRWTSKSNGRVVLGFGLEAKNVEMLQKGRPIICRGMVRNIECDFVIHYGVTIDNMIADLRSAGVVVPLPQNMDDIKLGATGSFPEGKFDANDEGELQCAITNEKGRVLIDFGKSLSWVGFTPASAREFAGLLIKNANSAEN